jgi:hypothetical protein
MGTGDLTQVINQESAWGFGQTVSVVLLGLTVTSFYSIFLIHIWRCPVRTLYSNSYIGGYSAAKDAQQIFKMITMSDIIPEYASQTTSRAIPLGRAGVRPTEESQEANAISRLLADTDSEQASTQFSSTLKEDRPWRKRLESELAYKYLYSLVYLLAWVVGADILILYAGFSSASVKKVTGSDGIRNSILHYGVWIVSNFGLLLLATLCFVVSISSSRQKLPSRLRHLVFTLLDIFFVFASTGIEVGLVFRLIYREAVHY